MATALPYIQAAGSIIGMMQMLRPAPQIQMPEKPPTLSLEEASQRAQGVLNPLYDDKMKQVLEGVDQDLIARGFFGQMPGAALTGSRAAQVESAKNAAIAALANDMQSGSEQRALDEQRLAAEFALNNQNMALRNRNAGMANWWQGLNQLGGLNDWMGNNIAFNIKGLTNRVNSTLNNYGTLPGLYNQSPYMPTGYKTFNSFTPTTNFIYDRNKPFGGV